MVKRPTVDLAALTSDAAQPMTEAAQRAPRLVPPRQEPKESSADYQGLAFKVPPAFRRRFRQRAATADLKLNELLFAALAAWEEKHGLG